MYALYPGADRPVSSRLNSYEESAMTNLNFPVSL